MQLGVAREIHYDILYIVANYPDIGGTVTLPLSCVPPSAMSVPNFRKDRHSNWKRFVILPTDESASTCAREMAN